MTILNAGVHDEAVALSALAMGIDRKPTDALKVLLAPEALTVGPSCRSRISTLTVFAREGAANTVMGLYVVAITVKGADGEKIETWLTIRVQAPIDLVASTQNMTVPTGSSASATISVTPRSGYTGLATFNTSLVMWNDLKPLMPRIDSPDVTAVVSPDTVNLVDGQPQSIQLTVIANTKAVSAAYHVSVICTDQYGDPAICDLEGHIQSGHFTLRADPGWDTAEAGMTHFTTRDITVAPIGNFSGTVTLAVTSVTDIDGSDMTPWISGAFVSSGKPTSVALSVPNTIKDALRITVSPSVKPTNGDCKLVVTGTDDLGNKSDVAMDVRLEAGYAIECTPGEVALKPGVSKNLAVSVKALGTQKGLVALDWVMIDNGRISTNVSRFAKVTFFPTSVQIDGEISVAKICIMPNAPTGARYELVIFGKDLAGRSAQCSISVFVGAPAISLTTDRNQVCVAAGDHAGQNLLATVKPIREFQGIVNLTATSITDAHGRPAKGLKVCIVQSRDTVSYLLGDRRFAVAVVADATTRPGRYRVALTGKGGACSSSASFVVNVNPVGSPTISVVCGAYEPRSPNFGEKVTCIVTATVKPARKDVRYEWSIGPVWYATDSSWQCVGIAPHRSYDAAWADAYGHSVVRPGTCSPILAVRFFDDMYYMAAVTCVATIGNVRLQGSTILEGNYAALTGLHRDAAIDLLEPNHRISWGPVADISFSPNGKWLVATGPVSRSHSTSSRAACWRVGDWKSIRANTSDSFHELSPGNVAWVSGKDEVAISSFREPDPAKGLSLRVCVSVWSVPDWRLISSWEHDTWSRCGMVIAPNGIAIVAYSAANGIPVICDLKTGKPEPLSEEIKSSLMSQPRDETDFLPSAAFSNDGRFLVVARGKRLFSVDVSTGKIVGARTLDAIVNTLQFQPVLNRVFAAFGDRRYQLFALPDLHPVLIDGQGESGRFAFASSGKWFVGGENRTAPPDVTDGPALSCTTIRLLDSTSFNEFGTIGPFRDGGAFSMSADGRYVAQAIDRGVKAEEPSIELFSVESSDSLLPDKWLLLHKELRR
ncbi:MAG: hypothetical protein P4L33_02305 [Capsulimonadaceae bacterium]|nr:hypothetical protein [Capsulimonadaceae bacterium]